MSQRIVGHPEPVTSGLRRGLNEPGTLVQLICLGGVLFIMGIVGVFGLFGDEVVTRAVGGVIAVLGLLLQGMAIVRFRRN